MQRQVPSRTPARGIAIEREKDFQAAIIELATLLHWKCWHDYDSRKNTPGFPDLVLCKPAVNGMSGRLIMAELKTDVGRVRPEQREWLAALAGVPGVLACVWRPRDWPAIQAALMGETVGVMALANIPERPAVKRKQAS